jgi:hypothetical protein
MAAPLLALPVLAPGVATSIGIGLGSAAVGFGLNKLAGGSSGGGVNTGSVNKVLQNYLGQLNAAVSAGRSVINKKGKKVKKEVKEYGDEYAASAAAASAAMWNSLGLFNEELIARADALTDAYDGDVMRALETLRDTTTQLNAAYSEDMGREISSFADLNRQIDENLASAVGEASEQFLGRISQAEEAFSSRTLSEADAAKAESMSLGDQFMQRAQGSLDRFDSFISSSPETLDELSKSVFQTRQQLLAEADPRALELSQIADNNAAAMMSGQISADMQANVARSSAMRALQGGFGASSEMGRGLTARDLGLTSLDLQQRGFDDFQRQRALNYETRVAGVQETARGLYNSMLGGEESLMRNTIGTAESDRNQRLGAVQEASAQRMQTFDRLFGSQLGTADTLRGQDVTLAAQRSDQQRDTALRATGMRIGATQDIYGNNWGLANTIFNTQTGLAGQRYNTGLSVSGDIYRTNVGAAGANYQGGMQVAGNIYSTRSQTANNVFQAQAAYEEAALGAMSGALGDVAATQANLPFARAAMQQGQAQQSAQIWGAALQAGSSLAGAYLGSQNFNAMPGRSFGGNYTQMYGPATGGNTGLSTPAGFGNFDARPGI